jgi:hypothetical protein
LLLDGRCLWFYSHTNFRAIFSKRSIILAWTRDLVLFLVISIARSYFPSRIFFESSRG